MKSLITGCAGFIGSHLSEALLKSGHKVVGIDCFTDYYPRKVKEANIRTIISDKNFDFHETDVLDLNVSILKDVDYVFHLAAQPGVRRSWEYFESYVKNNISATQRLLDVCKDFPIKRFVFASSSSVYGNAIPMKESSEPQPLSPYGITKLACEKLCSLYFNSYNVPVVTLRYFSVYGPRQRPDMAIGIFISKIMKGEKITIFGDGKHMRDFTFVEDVVEATILAAKKKCVGEIINIGNGKPVRLNDAIRIIDELTGKKAFVEYTDKQKGDAENTCADISKAEKTLGYIPKTDFRTGLKSQLAVLGLNK